MTGKEVSMTDNSDVFAEYGVIIKHGKKLEVGEGSRIGFYCVLECHGGVEIGKKVSIGPFVMILSSDKTNEGAVRKKTTIGDNAWIGGHVSILAGITIGKNALIGAGSVVTKDIPDNAVAFGVPCRVVRYKKEGDVR
jgi:maltose O-acetyltransferase